MMTQEMKDVEKNAQNNFLKALQETKKEFQSIKDKLGTGGAVNTYKEIWDREQEEEEKLMKEELEREEQDDDDKNDLDMDAFQ